MEKKMKINTILKSMIFNKQKKPSVTVFIVITLMLCNVFLSAQGRNYVFNGNFERSTDSAVGWTYTGEDSVILFNKNAGIDGSRCLQAKGKVGKIASARSKPIKIIPGVRYILSAQVRTEGFSYTGRSMFTIINDGWTWYVYDDLPKGDNEWTVLTKEFVAGSSPTGRYYIVFCIDKAEGMCWIDDIKLSVVDKEEEAKARKALGPANMFSAGNFESISQPFLKWPKDSSFVAELSTDSPFDGEQCLRLENPSIGSAVMYTYVPAESERAYILEMWTKIIVPPELIHAVLNFNKEGGGNGSAGRTVLKFDIPQLKNEWIKLVLPFTTTPDTAAIQFALALGNQPFHFFLDNIKIYPDPAGIKKNFRVEYAENPPKIDGQLTDEIWSITEELTPFLLNSNKTNYPKNLTSAWISYDSKNLYLAFRCLIKNRKYIQTAALQRDDANLWKDDGIEFFIMHGTGSGFQFIINAKGLVSDYRISQSSFGGISGLDVDILWNSSGKASSGISKNEFVIEAVIPLKDIGLDDFILLPNNDKVLFNLNRTDAINNELVTFSTLVGAHLQPRAFSEILKDDDALIITRNTGSIGKNIYSLCQENKIFSDLQTEKPANISISSWYGYGGLSVHMDKNIELAKKESAEQEYFKTIGQHGEYAPFVDTILINFREKGGITAIRDMHKKYNFKSMFGREGSGTMYNAVEVHKGEILDTTPWGASKRGTTPKIHPAYTKAALIHSTNEYLQYRSEKWTANFFYGIDEPNNNEEQLVSRTKNPKSVFIPELDKIVKEKFGFGKYGVPDILDPEFHKNPLAAELSFIAFARTWTYLFKKQRQLIYSELKKIDPTVVYMPLNCNFIEGVRFDDFSEYDTSMGAAIGCDPYASWIETEGRGMYNHGFGTKLVSDLTTLPQVMTIIQAFTYKGYSPNLHDIQTWVSRGLKMGASHIQYYDSDKYMQSAPDLFKEIMDMNRKIRSMNTLKIPRKADTAILYSLFTYMADGISSEANEAYTTYGVLGEKLNAWFKFISDSSIDSGKSSLSGYKLIFIPALRFGTEKVFNAVINALVFPMWPRLL